MHYKIDRSDVDKGKNDAMMMYFNRNSTKIDESFFGTPMSIVPIFSHFHDDDTKMKCTKHTQNQCILGSSLKSISLGGSQILNWADADMVNTLHRELMLVESTYDKTVVKK